MKYKTVVLEFTLNGKRIKKEIPSHLLLIDFLRDEMGLMGTKPGCREGECGACSVLVDGAAVNSCLYLAINVYGKEVTTIEGLSKNGILDSVQQALIRNGAVQCGFCSPGMAINIKSMQNFFKRSRIIPGREMIRKGLEGNLCRCTGYIKIIEAAEEALNAHGK